MDCRIARQFCMLLSRHPWLFTNWQVRAKIPPWIFCGLQKYFAILHAAKPPSMAFYGLASTSKKSILGFFEDCRIALQFCMLLSRHPWLFTSWHARCHYRHPKTAITEYQVCHYRGRPDNPLTISTISPSRIKPSLLPHSKQVVITVIPKPPLSDTKHFIIGNQASHYRITSMSLSGLTR